MRSFSSSADATSIRELYKSSMNLLQAGKAVGLKEEAAAPRKRVVLLSTISNMLSILGRKFVQPRFCEVFSSNIPASKADDIALTDIVDVADG